MDSTFAWILDEARRERFEEISELAFEWELNYSDLAIGYTRRSNCYYPFGWFYIPDESEGMFYGADYFTERDEVH